MKSILVFFFANFLLYGVNAQNELIFNEHAEPGKVYYKCSVKDYEGKLVEEQPVKILAFTKTEWKLELDTVYRDTLEKKNYQMVLTKEATTKWVYSNRVERRCISADPMDCVAVAYVEVPVQYRAVYFEDEDLYQLVEVKRVVRHSEIKLVEDYCADLEIEADKSRRVLLDENKNILYIKMAAGWWSEWRAVECPSVCGGYTFREIQIKMRDLGYYKGPIDDIINEELKAALTRFQKERGLPVGQLDMKTLKALGNSILMIQTKDRSFPLTRHSFDLLL